MSALAFRFYRGGVFLPSLGLWLDPHDPQTGPERVFVSHAHSDHTGLHREVILSRPTSQLMHARLSGEWNEHQLDFGVPKHFEGSTASFTLTLLPAGHIFGSAMAYIETGGSSLLYTGDFKLRAGLSSEKCSPRQADILIMETTFGRPVYQFPPSADVLKGVARFCREAIDNEETPVLLGYSLGKSQELLRGLAEVGLPIMLHGAVYKLTKIYEELGQTFPPYKKYEAGRARGHVLLCPPQVAGSGMLRQLAPTRVAVLTGWAIDPGCRFRYQAHAAFPLSDHADFPELLEMVKLVNPKQVFTLHGFAADFAQALRDRGYHAQALSQEEQLPLQLVFHDLTAAVQRTSISDKDVAQTRAGSPPTTPAVLPAGESETEIAEVTSFHEFALTCSRIGATAKKLEKSALLADYLKKLKERDIRFVSSWFTGHPFPPMENRTLQLGWAVIRDALCAVVGIDESDFGRFYLKHSDLGETAFEMLLNVSPATFSLSIKEVDQLFQDLHASRGPLRKTQILSLALRRCTALEGKYITKILTGDLRIGLKEGLVEEAIAQAFEVSLQSVRATNLVVGNIGETAELAKRGELNTAALVPFRPLKFMLASPEETATDIWQRVKEWSKSKADLSKNAPFLLQSIEAPTIVWLEDKYDGIRCQVHKVGDRVALYSRDLKEITATFLEIADAMRNICHDFLLDGELLAMRDDEVLPFADLQRRLGRREGDLFLGQQIPVQFVAFDLLWLNGEKFIDYPLSKRRAQLEQIRGPRLAQITRASSPEEIESTFNLARERGNEGLIVKDPDSIYTPGRRGLTWLKLKKAYATLDCVVVGAEYGHGKRRAVLSDYTFAVRDETSGQLKTIGKAYSGLTDVEIAGLTTHFLKKAIRQQGRYFEVEPDTVLEIAFDAIQPSDRHTSGLALRFPRIARIRTDKTPAQIDTVEAARRLLRSRGRPPVRP